MAKCDNALLLCKVDQEDCWIMGGIVLPCTNTETYEDAYNELKSKLESPEFVAKVIEEHSLESDLFEDDDYENSDFKFKSVSFSSGSVVYHFENSDEEEVDYRLSMDFVWLA